VDLQGGFDTVWNRSFSSSTRRKIRYASRAGVVIEADNTGKLVPAFYELYEESIARWAGQQNEPLYLARLRARWRDPLHKIAALAASLGDLMTIWIAWFDNRPVAGIVVLGGGNSAHYRMGAMKKDEAGHCQANYLLHCEAIRAACEAGYSSYHMGESGSSEGLAHFKERFGAVGHPYAEYILERLPLTSLDLKLRTLVKRLIRFKDA
jgi:lipid II:glycine glycyltransferase (peptidoglycan interpeptide bridge formation enzyme)